MAHWIGVTQGSILGPHLFCFMLTSPIKCTKLRYYFFVDDAVTLHYCDNNILFIEQLVLSDIKQIECWCQKNSMILNSCKLGYDRGNAPEKI